MRFIKYIALTAALISGQFEIAHASISVDASVGAGASVDEYVHDALTGGPSAATFASGLPGVALFMQRHLRRPGAQESAGLANIVHVPHFVFGESMTPEDIRLHFTRTFALIRDTLARHPGLTTVLINGEGSFSSMISAAPAPMQEGIRAILNEVIHATFDNLPGVTVQLNNMPYVAGGENMVPTRMVMGPATFANMGRAGNMPKTLIVNVFNPAASRQDFTWLLSQMIAGGLALPEGIPDVLLAPVESPASSAGNSADAESPLAVSTRSSESSHARPSGALTEEEEAQIAAAIAQFDDEHQTGGMVDDASPRVRPADEARVMRLIGDDDDLPPFDPSTEPDPDIRAALIASREQFLGRRSVPAPPVLPELGDDAEYRRAIEASLAGVNPMVEDDEEQMLAAAIERSMHQQRPATPTAAIDIPSIIVSWLETGSGDITLLDAQLTAAGLDDETIAEIIAAYS